MAVPTFIAVGSLGENTAGAITPGLPTGWAAGDLLLAHLWCSTNTAVWAVPSGWAQVASPVDDSNCKTVILYKIAQAGETATTFNLSSGTGERQGYVTAHRGVDQTTPIEGATSGWTGVATASVTLPSVTTTVADCLFVETLFTDLNGASAHTESWTTPTGMAGEFSSVHRTTGGSRTASFWSWKESRASAGATGTRSTTGSGSAASYGHAYHAFAIRPGAVTQNLAPGSITSAEAIGSATVSARSTVSPSGLASAGAFGTAVLGLVVAPGGIASAGALGSPSVSGLDHVLPSGIASEEAFGTDVIFNLNREVAPSSIASAEALGALTVKYLQRLFPTGISSAAAMPSPVVFLGGIQVDIGNYPIPSAEAVGEPFIAKANDQWVALAGQGIPSEEAFSEPFVSSVHYIRPSYIGSNQAFGGTYIYLGHPTLGPTSIPSAAAFGVPLVAEATVWISGRTTGLEWHVTGLWYPGADSVAYYGRIADPRDGLVDIPLNDSRRAGVTVSTLDPLVSDILENAYGRCLRVYYRDKLVFWGAVHLGEAAMGDGTVRLSATDPSLMLIHHYLRRGDLDGALNASNGDKGTVTIDHLGLRQLRDAGTTEHFPRLGIINGTNDFPAAPDSLMGVFRGDELWGTMQQLAASLGPDFELEPVEGIAGAYAKLNTYKRQGSDVSKRVAFHYGTGLQNLQDLQFTVGSKFISMAHVLSRDGRYRVTSANAEALLELGQYTDWDATDYDAKQATASAAEAVLSAYGHDIIRAYGRPLLTVDLLLPQEAEGEGYQYLTDYKVGDTIGAAGRADAIELPDSTYRITQVSLAQASLDDNVQPALQVVADRTGALGDTIFDTGDE